MECKLGSNRFIYLWVNSAVMMPLNWVSTQNETGPRNDGPISTWTFATDSAPSAFLQQISGWRGKRALLEQQQRARPSRESAGGTSQHHSSLGKWSVKVYILTDRTPWRIFSHWIEKRIPPPSHPNPLLGDSHCYGGTKSFAAKIKTLSSLPIISMLFFFIFNFSVWPVGGEEARTNGSSSQASPHSVLKFILSAVMETLAVECWTIIRWRRGFLQFL